MSTTPKHRNRFETKVANSLGSQYEYESIWLDYTPKARRYKPDFVDAANRTVVEAKGFWPADERAKMLAVIQQNPTWTFIMVFQDATKTISKSSTTTYGDWCTRHGIAWRQA